MTKRELAIGLDEFLCAVDYDQETGKFTWKVSSGSARAGQPANCIQSQCKPYVSICYRGVRVMAHRLAWAFKNGRWPDGQIDHINGDKSDNRITNLREVTASINSQNQKRPKASNKTGFLGVSPSKWGTFVAQINIGGERAYLGTYKTPEQAHAVYLEAKRKHHQGCTI